MFDATEKILASNARQLFAEFNRQPGIRRTRQQGTFLPYKAAFHNDVRVYAHASDQTGDLYIATSTGLPGFREDVSLLRLSVRFNKAGQLLGLDNDELTTATVVGPNKQDVKMLYRIIDPKNHPHQVDCVGVFPLAEKGYTFSNRPLTDEQVAALHLDLRRYPLSFNWLRLTAIVS